MLIDSHGRSIDYIRISVTDRCNLRCRYCMPEEGIALLTHDDILRFEEVAAFAQVAVQEGIKSIRITGGEPLVKKGITRLVGMLAALEGLEDLAMTTNGVLLSSMARELRAAGLRRVNIGLPSLEARRYEAITRRAEPEARQAWQGMLAALEAGLAPVKVNVVVMRGYNDDLSQVLELIRNHPIELRFIEFMPMGPTETGELLVTAEELAQRLQQAAWAPLVPVERAEGRGPVQHTMRVGDSAGTVGVIAAMTEHFCDRCNRLRLTADGHLRSCLFSDGEVDIKGALRPALDTEKLRSLLHEAVASKPACMPAVPRRGKRMMGQVGG
jgi:cyclic pyranopterin phosphate synthase